MKLRPKPVPKRELPIVSWYALGVFNCVSVFFLLLIAIFPALRSYWGLLLFVPSSLKLAIDGGQLHVSIRLVDDSFDESFDDALTLG